jgi:hypothetical protein
LKSSSLVAVTIFSFTILSGCGIKITSPPDGSQFRQGDTVRLKAVRKIGASSIHDFEWSSSIDGHLGTGDELLVTAQAAGGGPLSPSQHTITAEHPGLFIWHKWRDSLSVTVVECTEADSDVTTGSTGSLTPVAQSFNETRAVDVTVLGSSNRIVEKLILKGLNISVGATSALVGARIYDSSTQALVGSSDVTVAGGSADMTVTVVLSATLEAGKSYRIGFYVETTPLWQANGKLYRPDEFSSPYSPMPYAENSGVFRINSAHSGVDSYPNIPNISIPQMTIHTRCHEN